METNWDLLAELANRWHEVVCHEAKEMGFKITEFALGRGGRVKGTFVDSASATATRIVAEHGEACAMHATAMEYLKNRAALIALSKRDKGISLDDGLHAADEEFLTSLCVDYRAVLTREMERLQSNGGLFGLTYWREGDR